MKTSLVILSLCAGVFASAAPIVVNGGFETNNVGSGNYLYPAGSGTGHDGVVADPWTFVNGAGITSNNTAWGGVSNSGDYFAFLQSGLGSTYSSSISQTLSLDAFKEYTVSFYARQRGGYGQNIVTTVGNSQVVFGGVPASATGWTLYTGNFYSTGTMANLSFSVTGGTTQDSGSFIDDVSVNAVPSPAALCTFGVSGLGMLRRRRASKKA